MVNTREELVAEAFR